MRYSFEQDIPFVDEAEVIVVGGGPGGIGAAVSAARNGTKTVLIEQNGQLGGMSYAGQVQPFMPNHINHKTLDKPILGDWIKAMRRYLPKSSQPITPDLSEWRDLAIVSKEAAMLAAEDLCLEAGVKLLYHHTLFDVVKENNKISAIILLGKDGLSAIKAKVFIDSTGDGDLAAKAGCEYEYGDGKTGDCQPMTLFFRMSGVSAHDKRAAGDEINQLYKKAKESGRITHNPRDVIWTGYAEEAPGNAYFNATRICGKNPLKAQELSEAEVEGRAQVRELFLFMRASIRGYENSELHSIASTIGVRESRRVYGRYYLTIQDYDALRKFPDAIARVHYGVDIHSSKGEGCTYREMPENDWYEIPYGSIVARDVDNLLLGSRCVSADHYVNSSLRIMPVVCSIGQAAGMAAAISVKDKKEVFEIDGVELRRKLIAFGARLDNFEVIDKVRTSWDQP
ncbi:MAG: hypothetical protein A2X49_05845 [Lentisphaerae bacterium GWF2_52_8]|nr:MAG: hypothetical protein A2X49_05845 [Lentisphaerae bacterium GWF2_52_8]